MKPTEGHLRLVSNRRKATAGHESSDGFFDEPDFKEILRREKKRSQRSMKPLILMRLDISGMMIPTFTREYRELMKALAACIRETDIRGWYKHESILGILFTEIASAAPSVRERLFQRVMAHLVSAAGPSVLFKIGVTFHTFPEDKKQDYPVGHHDSSHLTCHANSTDATRLSEKIQGWVHAARSHKTFTSLLIDTLNEPMPNQP